jgi:ABC-type branched-subunit amino acid transport system ATPase component
MHGACAQYGRVRVLEQIEFSLRGGESVAILGANGAGKTTLLRAISGLMAQRSGQILTSRMSGQKLP